MAWTKFLYWLMNGGKWFAKVVRNWDGIWLTDWWERSLYKNYVYELLEVEVQELPRVEDIFVPCECSSKPPSVREGLIPGLYKTALPDRSRHMNFGKNKHSDDSAVFCGCCWFSVMLLCLLICTVKFVWIVCTSVWKIVWRRNLKLNMLSCSKHVILFQSLFILLLLAAWGHQKSGTASVQFEGLRYVEPELQSLEGPFYMGITLTQGWGPL